MWKANDQNRIFINCVLSFILTIDTWNPTLNSFTLKDFKFLHFNLQLVRIFQSKRQSKQRFYVKVNPNFYTATFAILIFHNKDRYTSKSYAKLIYTKKFLISIPPSLHCKSSVTNEN